MDEKLKRTTNDARKKKKNGKDGYTRGRLDELRVGRDGSGGRGEASDEGSRHVSMGDGVVNKGRQEINTRVS